MIFGIFRNSARRVDATAYWDGAASSSWALKYTVVASPTLGARSVKSVRRTTLALFGMTVRESRSRCFFPWM
jgi:hypothetical protein